MSSSSIAPAKQSRIHGLDAMRAVMMLLGIVIHASASYVPAPPNESWQFRDPSSSSAMLFVGLFIHAFRMPAFYAVAGFFAALVIERQGVKGFVQNRAMRILLPFAVGWLALYPLTNLGFGLGNTGELSLDLDLYRIGWHTPGVLIHLWFLYFLLIMYGLALVARRLAQFWPTLASRVRLAAAWMLESRWRLVLISLPSAAILMPSGFLATPLTLSPDLRALAAYGYAFFVGWHLYSVRQDLGRLLAAWPVYLAAGVVASLVQQYSFLQLRSGNAGLAMSALTTCGAAVACWGVTLGSLGLFLQCFARSSKTVRYLVDASYWVYLIHLPIVTITAGLLKTLAWTAFGKFFVVLLVATAGSLVTYELCVRYTRIGAVLHGARVRPDPARSQRDAAFASA